MNTRTVMALAGLVPLPVAINLAEEFANETTYKTKEEVYYEHVRREREIEKAECPDYAPGVLWP